MSRKKYKEDPMWVFDVYSKKETREIEVQNGTPMSKERCTKGREKCVVGHKYKDQAELKQDLNWIFNGDSNKYCLEWVMQNSTGDWYGVASVYY